MPLIAMRKSDNARVNILDHKQPRIKFRYGDLCCPYCESDMIVVDGSKVISHFRHKSECTSGYASHPESAAHLMMKKIVSEKLKKDIPEYGDAEAFLEYPVPEINRIIDVAFIFRQGWKVAHEIQLSSITYDVLQERTSDYHAAGFDVFWWLGQKANTDKNKDWCAETFGCALTLDFTYIDTY